MPRITIIETGLVSLKNRELHGSYPQMFEHMIGVAGARTILSCDVTPHAGLLYAGDTTLSVQPHPEFSVGFALACCEMVRKGDAPDGVVTSAKASLAEPLDSARLGGAITRFLVGAR